MIRRLLAPIVVALAAWLATSPALDGSYVYDDAQYVVENLAVSGEAPLWTSPLGHPRQGLWRPLTVLSFRWQWEGPSNARPMHMANILLHVVASLLSMMLARRLGLGRTAALVTGLLFAVHPVHAESVAWVTGRAELLATVWVLIGWMAWLSSSRMATLGCMVAIALAGLSKENALVAPALFVAGDLLLRKRQFPWGRLAGLAVITGALLAARLALLPHPFPIDGPFTETAFGGRCVVALNILGTAVRLLLWPGELRVEYQRQEFLLVDPANLYAAAALLALIAWLYKRQAVLALGLLIIPLALLPVLNLLPIGEAFGERFLYLPSVGFCLAVGALFQLRARHELASSKGLGLSVAVVLIGLLAAIPASRAATRVFQNDLSLWRHAAQMAPDLPLVRYNLGLFLDREGRHLTEDRDQTGCIEELQASLQLDPNHVYAGYAHEILGIHALGQRELHVPPDLWMAAEHFRAATKHVPELFEARINLAAISSASPAVVGQAEALAALALVTIDAGASSEQVHAAKELERQLSPSASGSSSNSAVPTGTSSPDGS
ncbi:MAG: hypothetical protein P8N09_06965 [Planctomycetota bacterium]|nr:hypothetical protein [Planctomycetota bacterium]